MLTKMLARRFRALAGAIDTLGQDNLPSEKTKASRPALFESLEDRTMMSTYYVSSTGNDANAGTSTSAAFRSINKLNTMTFKPGDKILFEGGKTFSGNLKFNEYEVGSSSAPITVSSYGSGKAIISAGTGNAIYGWKTGGYAINNLKLVGSGSSNTGAGIHFVNPKANGYDFDYLRFDNLEATGFMDGIKVGSINQTSGYNNVRITNSSVYENNHAGLFVYNHESKISHANWYIGNVKAYSNYGGGGPSNQTGSGIQVWGVDGATIERCVAYNNGYKAGDGNIGIWVSGAKRITMQYNESYNNISRGGRDGGGFDFDYTVSDSVMQYNYAHGNHGNGITLAHALNNGDFYNNTIRYNILENNGRGPGDAEIKLWGKMNNVHIYNNTMFIKNRASANTARAIKIHNTVVPTLYATNVYVRNNIIMTEGGNPLVEVTSGQLAGAKNLQFQGNVYYNTTSASNWKIMWGSKSYYDLNSFRSGANQEKLSGVAVGSSANPMLSGYNKNITIGDAFKLNTLSAYKLTTSSPALNKGVNLTSLGVSKSPSDFWGSNIFQGTGFEIGADEVGTGSVVVAAPQGSISAPTTPTTPTSPTSPTTPTTPTTPTVSTPSTPTGFTGTGTSTGIQLKWNAVSGSGVQYKIEVHKSGSTYAEVARVSGTSWIHANTVKGVTYNYRLSAVNSAGSSGFAYESVLSVTSTITGGMTGGDIGGVGEGGSNSGSGSSHTVTAAGSDIFKTADSFRFVYKMITGDATIIAKVSSQTYNNTWAKAGVMIRESTASNAKNVSMLVTPANGATMQTRATTGGSTAYTQKSGYKAPTWTKLVRTGSTFRGYVSNDGVNWSLVSTQTVSMNASVLVGLAVTSHDASYLSTTKFDNVSIA